MEGSKAKLGLALTSRQPGDIIFATKEDKGNIMEVQLVQIRPDVRDTNMRPRL